MFVSVYVLYDKRTRVIKSTQLRFYAGQKDQLDAYTILR